VHHSGYLRPGRQRLETIVAMIGVSRVDDCVRVPRESMWTLFYLACALAISFLLFFVFEKGSGFTITQRMRVGFTSVSRLHISHLKKQAFSHLKP